MFAKTSDEGTPDPAAGGGFHAFFDATYAEVKLGFLFLGQKEDGVTNSSSYFSIGVLGKYPIELGGFTLFPMLGFEYNIFTSAKAEGETLKRADLSGFGVGKPLMRINSFFNLALGQILTLPIIFTCVPAYFGVLIYIGVIWKKTLRVSLSPNLTLG